MKILQADCSAVDAADQTGPPTLDSDGTPRSHGAGFDVGAFGYYAQE
jgi:hypothetical protein